MEKLEVKGVGNEEVKKVAYKYAIKNAFEHETAQVGAVVGKVKALFPDAIIGQIMPLINEIIKEVNSFSKEKIKEEYDLFNEIGFELKQVEKEKTLPELNWLNEKEKIITRAAPCPTGPMHFGHARPYILTDEYVKKYGGKYFMRFDDTDPKVKIPEKEMEEEFLKNFNWLGIKIDKIFRQSDNLKRYHQVIKTLIADGVAYVCFCEQEKWREKIWKGEACPCREKDVKEQLKHFKEMLKWKLKEGSCVVRMKTDLKNKDSSTRDFWIAKIVDDPTKHPNKKTHKTHVWPAYNLASVVDDYDMGINFTIRGQEHIPNEKKQKMILTHFNWPSPHNLYHGKVSKLGDMVLSKSKMKIIMQKDGILRYDDPRMATMQSFRRRGIRPEAIRKIILHSGLNITEVKIDNEIIANANKSVLGEVHNYPFIEDGIEIEVNNCKNGIIRYNRNEIKINNPIQKFIIDRKEMNFKENDIIRLKDGMNIQINQKNEFGVNASFISFEKSGYKSINWLTKENSFDARVLMPDGTEKLGLTLQTIKKEKNNTVIQFNNLGYVNIEKEGYLIFAHE